MRILGFIILSLFFSLPSYSGPRICSDEAGKVVGAIFVMSGPALAMHKEIEVVVKSNAGAFSEGGEITRCMRMLSDSLLVAAVGAPKAYPPMTATERWLGSMPPGLEHLPSQVDRSMGPDLTGAAAWDQLFMSQELRWLSDVLPEAAKGNWAPYNAQGTSWRREGIQAVAMIPQLCSLLGQQACKAMAEPMVTLIMARAQQIFNLATGR